jgi:hypothetical protein
LTELQEPPGFRLVRLSLPPSPSEAVPLRRTRLTLPTSAVRAHLVDRDDRKVRRLATSSPYDFCQEELAGECSGMTIKEIVFNHAFFCRAVAQLDSHSCETGPDVASHMHLVAHHPCSSLILHHDPVLSKSCRHAVLSKQKMANQRA